MSFMARNPPGCDMYPFRIGRRPLRVKGARRRVYAGRPASVDWPACPVSGVHRVAGVRPSAGVSHGRRVPIDSGALIGRVRH